MKTLKNILYSLGILAIAAVAIINFSISMNSNGKDLVNITLKALESNASAGEATNTKRVNKRTFTDDVWKYWTECDGQNHRFYKRQGKRVDCEGTGDIICTPGWVSKAGHDTESNGSNSPCEGPSCVIIKGGN